MRSGVRRAIVRSVRRWRMISCPAANGIRWVKPSMTTRSPSRTKRETASFMVMTLDIKGTPCHLGGRMITQRSGPNFLRRRPRRVYRSGGFRAHAVPCAAGALLSPPLADDPTRGVWMNRRGLWTLTLAALFAGLAIPACMGAGTSAKPVEFKTDDDRTLYALGVTLGNNIAPYGLTAEEIEFVKKG